MMEVVNNGFGCGDWIDDGGRWNGSGGLIGGGEGKKMVTMDDGKTREMVVENTVVGGHSTSERRGSGDSNRRLWLSYLLGKEVRALIPNDAAKWKKTRFYPFNYS
ncbi:hypothetical protein L484_019676 [Morus notabilis]|uniref:Uncharacterized protein n=1 Tax=Morus notabilis TaxID=981085 RepID=W9QDC8_9ROSA|nr:hypothetical protein L484_019676 [Morus notabilis]